MDWETQAKQFQAELDRVNPLLDAATARVGQLEAEAKLAASEATTLIGNLASVEMSLTEKSQQCDSLTALVKEGEAAAQDAMKAIAAAREEINRLKSALVQKNAALAPCLKGVSDQLAYIQAAIQAGE